MTSSTGSSVKIYFLSDNQPATFQVMEFKPQKKHTIFWKPFTSCESCKTLKIKYIATFCSRIKKSIYEVVKNCATYVNCVACTQYPVLTHVNRKTTVWRQLGHTTLRTARVAQYTHRYACLWSLAGNILSLLLTILDFLSTAKSTLLYSKKKISQKGFCCCKCTHAISHLRM
jgi:hypothetical protein